MNFYNKHFCINRNENKEIGIARRRNARNIGSMRNIRSIESMMSLEKMRNVMSVENDSDSLPDSDSLLDSDSLSHLSPSDSLSHLSPSDSLDFNRRTPSPFSQSTFLNLEDKFVTGKGNRGDLWHNLGDDICREKEKTVALSHGHFADSPYSYSHSTSSFSHSHSTSSFSHSHSTSSFSHSHSTSSFSHSHSPFNSLYPALAAAKEEDLYENNSGTSLAIIVQNKIILASDTRHSAEYNINSRFMTKIFQIGEIYLTTTGFYADSFEVYNKMKYEIKQYEIYKPITVEAAAHLLFNLLYSRRFFPLYVYATVSGFSDLSDGETVRKDKESDSERDKDSDNETVRRDKNSDNETVRKDKDSDNERDSKTHKTNKVSINKKEAVMFTFDCVGSYQRSTCRCDGSGAKMIQPLLDSWVAGKNFVNYQELNFPSALELVKKAFDSAAEVDVKTKDYLEIYVIDQEGSRHEVIDLRKD